MTQIRSLSSYLKFVEEYTINDISPLVKIIEENNTLTIIEHIPSGSKIYQKLSLSSGTDKYQLCLQEPNGEIVSVGYAANITTEKVYLRLPNGYFEDYKKTLQPKKHTLSVLPPIFPQQFPENLPPYSLSTTSEKKHKGENIYDSSPMPVPVWNPLSDLFTSSEEVSSQSTDTTTEDFARYLPEDPEESSLSSSSQLTLPSISTTPPVELKINPEVKWANYTYLGKIGASPYKKRFFAGGEEVGSGEEIYALSKEEPEKKKDPQYVYKENKMLQVFTQRRDAKKHKTNTYGPPPIPLITPTLEGSLSSSLPSVEQKAVEEWANYTYLGEIGKKPYLQRFLAGSGYRVPTGEKVYGSKNKKRTTSQKLKTQGSSSFKHNYIYVYIKSKNKMHRIVSSLKLAKGYTQNNIYGPPPIPLTTHEGGSLSSSLPPIEQKAIEKWANYTYLGKIGAKPYLRRYFAGSANRVESGEKIYTTLSREELDKKKDGDEYPQYVYHENKMHKVFAKPETAKKQTNIYGPSPIPLITYFENPVPQPTENEGLIFTPSFFSGPSETSELLSSLPLSTPDSSLLTHSFFQRQLPASPSLPSQQTPITTQGKLRNGR